LYRICGSNSSPNTKQPSLRPSLPCVAISDGSAYQAPCTTIARMSALLLSASSPASRIDDPFDPQ